MANTLQQQIPAPLQLRQELDTLVRQDLFGSAGGERETAQGLRHTISEPARREVLTRLLQLNHQRYAEEVAVGLHEKGKKRESKGAGGQGRKKQPTKGRAKKDDGQMSLF